MASSAAVAPSTRFGTLQIAAAARLRGVRDAVERWLEAERDQLILWLPVMIGAGVTAWFLLPDRRSWIIALLGCGGVALLALAVARHGRAGRAVAVGAMAMALGLALVWWRAETVGVAPLTRATIATIEARVERVEPLPSRDLVRVRLTPFRALAAARPDWRRDHRVKRGAAQTAGVSVKRQEVTLPAHIRTNIATADVPAGLSRGAVVVFKARLMPPPEPDVPGAYDYARVAWFDGIGATGRAFAPVQIASGGKVGGAGLRERLSRHIQSRVPGGGGAIAATLATGDKGAIPDDDAEAMRRAGLAHLLAVSGLHLTAVVGVVMLVVMRLLALSPWLALRFRLPLVAAAAGAVGAIGYTLLTGAAVPTIRACVAALLVLTAMMMGREALTLRLVATGAVIVLWLYPESLAGPSFQLSFAAVTTIVALHEFAPTRRWFGPREEGRVAKIGRGLLSLLATGLAVELTLMPIAFYHFHKAGIYGALANIVAIPLTTLVVMPTEALALLLDTIGIGAPVWWVTGKALMLLLWIAHTTEGLPGSVAALPSMPATAYGLMIGGGLWIALWRTRWRRLGIMPLAIGALWAVLTPAPDLLVTGDGRHAAIRTADGGLALLRDRVGDYTSDMLMENGGVDGDPLYLSEQPDARCSRDLCLAERVAGGRKWRILATRSAYPVDIKALTDACRAADIVISERRLPRNCTPRWLKLDKPMLAKTGGLSITFASQRVVTVAQSGDRHPWRVAARAVSYSGAGYRRAYPARGSARGHNAAGHRRGWRDRAGSSRPRGGNI